MDVDPTPYVCIMMASGTRVLRQQSSQQRASSPCLEDFLSSRPALSSETRTAIGRASVLTRYRNPGDPEVEDARRDAAAARLTDYVAAVVAEAPPLTDAQRDRIAALLRPAGGGGR